MIVTTITTTNPNTFTILTFGYVNVVLKYAKKYFFIFIKIFFYQKNFVCRKFGKYKAVNALRQQIFRYCNISIIITQVQSLFCL